MRSEPSTEGRPHAGGESDLVQLDRDHPGFRDAAYRARRNTIARLALEYVPGTPVPAAPYSEEEHGVWRSVWEQLGPLHDQLASSAALEAAAKLQLDRDRIPQLSDLNPALLAATGFSMLPVAGLVSPRTFLSYLVDDVFLSTQYVRHHSRPLYTPEPDVIHELVGHAATLIDPQFAELNRLFGRAMVAAPDVQRELEVTRLYWYTVEFGVMAEHGAVKAWGAGCLSSIGELQRMADPSRHRPLEVDAVIATPYDPTDFQPVYYVAESLEHVRAVTEDWLATWST